MRSFTSVYRNDHSWQLNGKLITHKLLSFKKRFIKLMGESDLINRKLNVLMNICANLWTVLWKTLTNFEYQR
jgi:hypothetical protein